MSTIDLQLTYRSMKVLSLFDWIACGYEALLRAWIPIDKYYASEIDKHAIQIAMKNHPDIIQIWDVTNIKWESYKDIDLLIGGSPCQWFSIAWKMLNFDDPRSKLFFEYVRLLKEIHPKYFLLENVKMKKEWQDIISSALWVQPIEINSSLVSAQSRKRLYWTNISNVSQPKDKWILLKDILEKNVDEKYNISDRLKWLIEYKTPTLWWKIKRIWGAYGQTTRWWVYDIEWQAPTITASMWMWGGHVPMVLTIPQTVKVRKYDVDIRWLKSELREHKNLSNKEIAERLDVPKTTVDHWFRPDNSFAIPDAKIRFKLKELLWITTDRFDKSITEFEERQWVYEKAERKILPSWKMTTLTTSQNDDIIDTYYRIRKLTPIECERLQTLPDNYTWWASDTQRYKMLWNWWTVDVIAHIFSFINHHE